MAEQDHLVDLFIVGQPKSGTTALAHYLSQHPEICISVPKEPNYFATDIIRDSDAFHGRAADYHIRTPEAYASLFDHAKDERFLAEASTVYIYSEQAAENIYKYNPDAKIIISLREPVSLMHSLHMQYVNETTEDEVDFQRALDKEPLRKEGKELPPHTRSPSLLYYSERIKYAQQIERFLNIFPRESILIFTAEELRNNTDETYRSILSLVGADTSFAPEFVPVHESKKPRLAWANQVLHNPRFRKIAHGILGPKLYTHLHKRFVDRVLLKEEEREPLPEDLERKLKESAWPEVEKVSKLLDYDFAKDWQYQ